MCSCYQGKGGAHTLSSKDPHHTKLSATEACAHLCTSTTLCRINGREQQHVRTQQLKQSLKYSMAIIITQRASRVSSKHVCNQLYLYKPMRWCGVAALVADSS